MKTILKLMRVKHYIKNILIFLPIIFSYNFSNTTFLIKTIISFISFCLIASCVYIFNDIQDKDLDSKHPKKKNRPIASGKISIKFAYLILLIIFIVSHLLLFLISSSLYVYVLLDIYLVINILYSVKLKHIPILDVTILMLGFLIRVLFGALVINVLVSPWLYLTVISFSYYLGLGKRRNELDKNGKNSRKVLEFYNKNFLDKMMYVFLSSTIVFYSLWCINVNIKLINFYLASIPMIMFIIMQYSLIIESDSYGDPVDVLLENKTLLISSFIYVIYMGSILLFVMFKGI